LEPDARSLYDIRNNIEHRYFKVHEMLVRVSASSSDMWNDELAYSVERRAFEAKTLHLFRLVRAAMIYLSLSMHQEERRRHPPKENEITAPMVLDVLRDDWKM
jgi:hypothetical protein